MNELVLADQRAKEEERQRQEAERRRQEQKRQKREADAAERKRQEEDARKKAVKGVLQTLLDEGNNPCWFCKKNEANGKPEIVQLTDWKSRSASVNVPRCAICQRRHAKLRVFYWGPTAIAGCILLAGLLGLVTVSTGLLGTISFFVFVAGGTFWACIWRMLWLQNTVAEFPAIKQLLIAGLKFRTL